jgi:hypothetical protein
VVWRRIMARQRLRQRSGRRRVELLLFVPVSGLVRVRYREPSKLLCQFLHPYLVLEQEVNLRLGSEDLRLFGGSCLTPRNAAFPAIWTKSEKAVTARSSISAVRWFSNWCRCAIFAARPPIAAPPKPPESPTTATKIGTTHRSFIAILLASVERVGILGVCSTAACCSLRGELTRPRRARLDRRFQSSWAVWAWTRHRHRTTRVGSSRCDERPRPAHDQGL